MDIMLCSERIDNLQAKVVEGSAVGALASSNGDVANEILVNTNMIMGESTKEPQRLGWMAKQNELKRLTRLTNELVRLTHLLDRVPDVPVAAKVREVSSGVGANINFANIRLTACLAVKSNSQRTRQAHESKY